MDHHDNKEKCILYLTKLFKAQFARRTIIWVDETNFNLYCKWREGQAKIGSRTSVVVPSSKGANLHFIGAMSANQWIHFTTQRRAFKNAECSEWFRELANKCIAAGIQSPAFVVDNAPAHSRLELLEEEFERLAPYSYLLNPIEIVWSSFKSNVNKELRNKMQSLLNTSRSAEETISELRMRDYIW